MNPPFLIVAIYMMCLSLLVVKVLPSMILLRFVFYCQTIFYNVRGARVRGRVLFDRGFVLFVFVMFAFLF